MCEPMSERKIKKEERLKKRKKKNRNGEEGIGKSREEDEPQRRGAEGGAIGERNWELGFLCDNSEVGD